MKRKSIKLILAATAAAVALGTTWFSLAAGTTALLDDQIEKEGTRVVKYQTASIQMAGSNAADTAAAYLNTWHILNANVADFTWDFDYTPTNADWNFDKFFFRSTEENEWNSYCFSIQGNELAGGSAKIEISQGEGYTSPYVSQSLTLEADTTYHAKITVSGKNVTVLFYKKSDGAPATPTLTTTLPDENYWQEGDFQIVSWAGKFTISGFKIATDSKTWYAFASDMPAPSSAVSSAASSSAVGAVSSTASTATAPKTGDGLPVAPIAVLAAVSLTLGALLYSKRR